MNCPGCESSDKDPNFVFQTNYWKVFLNPKQTYLGRSIATLKRHCASLSDLTNEEWDDFVGLVKIIESAYKKALSATLFNWSCLMNDAYQNEPPNPHVHWHLRPRYENPVRLFGLTFEDLEFGHHYARPETSYTAPQDIQEKIIERLRESLEGEP